MSQFFSNLYTLLLRPQLAFATLGSRAYWWQAATLLWLISTFFVLSQAGAWRLEWTEIFPVLLVVWGSVFFTWLSFSLVFSLMADLFGGQGRITDTMTATGLATLPFVFLPIIDAFPNLLGKAGFTLQLLSFLSLIFWSLVLVVLGLTSAQKISLDRAIGSLIMSGFIIIALSISFVVLSISQVVLIVGQWI